MSNCMTQRSCNSRTQAFKANGQAHVAFKANGQAHVGKGRARPTVRCAARIGTGCQMDRRDMLLASLGLATMVATSPATASDTAVEASKLASFQDSQLAYQFLYPVQTSSGKPLALRLARGPSTYNGAPLLTPDGRQRIVTQLMDLRRNVTVTLTVGPAAGVLKEKEPTEWQPNEVAITVLVDRSTARVSSGQRIALNDVEEVRKEEREGAPYWLYEHVSQGSPTITNPEKDNYRHAVAATTFRPGQSGRPYLYTLNLSCPQDLWDDMEPLFLTAVDSFRLTAPSKDYVAPDSGFSLF